MKRYSVAEARSKLARIIDEIKSDGPIELTRRGEPVAVMISHQELDRLTGQRPDFATLYNEFLERHDLSKDGVDERFADSLRDRDPGREVSF